MYPNHRNPRGNFRHPYNSRFRNQESKSENNSNNSNCKEKNEIDNNPRRNRSNFREERKFPIGVEVLKNLLDREPYIIPLELLKPGSGYTLMLQELNIKTFKIELTIKLLFKCIRSQANIQGVCELLLLTMKNANFISHLQKFMSSIKYEDNGEKAKYFLPMILAVLNKLLILVPMVAFEIVNPLADICTGIIMQLKFEGHDITDIEKASENIQIHVREVRSKFNKEVKVRSDDGRGPPNDIKDLEVVPTCEELNCSSRPFIRPNIVEGPYTSSSHYLDVHFRLLKEDFVRPLREGLQHYRDESSGRKGLDVRVYKKVKLHHRQIDNSEFVYYLELNINNRMTENLRMLMYGNVLCISDDNFQTMTIATMHDRDNIHNKLIGVKIEKSNCELSYNSSYTMLESKAYFVSYKHTLKALQSIDDMPLKDYLVEVKENDAHPIYLEDETKYELPKSFCPTGDPTLAFEMRVLAPLTNWLSPETFGFDESQLKAFHGALTRKVAIIQGPPGTGKTFIGLKIVETLLLNKTVWNVRRNPILVVCYTNHALDQFLEGLLKFTTNIIRVGSRSKSEELREYQINRRLFIKKGTRQNRSLEYLDQEIVNKTYHNSRIEMAEIKGKHQAVIKLIQKFEAPAILTVNTFISHGVIPQKWKCILTRVSLRYFLFQSFLEGNVDELLPTNFDLATTGEDIGNEDLNINEDMIENEYQRKLEIRIEDEDFLDTDHRTDQNFLSGVVQPSFEVTDEDVVKEIENVKTDLKKDEFSYYAKENMKRILRILTVESRVLRSHSKLLVSEREYQQLEASAPKDLGIQNRWKLYNHWRTKIIDDLNKKKLDIEKNCGEAMNRMETARELAYINAMKTADLIGMTTTGASQYCRILHDLGPSIVLVEEAAEILESHVVSALSTKCEHLILIGDHLQLQPKPNVYELATKYKLSTSLFERLINNGIHYNTLEFQHRMKPLFSNLIVPTIYDNLKDHESVLKFPKIKGIEKDLFFIDHEVFENKPYEDSESFENMHEAQFLMGLCRHLILQCYSPSDITIIAPYSGQFRCLRKLQKNSFPECQNVRITILDNYQGEECDIILLSLVRSNEIERVGFMKTENRICVALSRARYGMYIIGNMQQMMNSSDLWSKINDKLTTGDNIGTEMTIICENHPEIKKTVKSLEDFTAKSPQGGCLQLCGQKLSNCEHACPQKCHIIDSAHENVKCWLPCSQVCEIGHPCAKLCHEICGSCPVQVDKVLPCNHKQKVPCGISTDEFNCKEFVTRILKHCGHTAKERCYVDVSLIVCAEDCKVRLDCGHQCRKKCHVQKDAEHLLYDCREKCERTPENCSFEHCCAKQCFEECGPCPKIVDKKLSCGHITKKIICGKSVDDIVCRQKCKRALPCGHFCPRKCYEECGGCKVLVDKTVPECGHTVKITCEAVPKTLFCGGKCTKILPCGHSCKEKCCAVCTKECKERIASTVLCPKKHSVKLPCYISNNYPNQTLSSEEIGKFCEETCGAKLDCGHFCASKCGECFNGRLHVNCTQDCKKALVCGHVCKSPCSEKCPPCAEKCPWKCPHSRCYKNCGQICVNCKEPCRRSCKHTGACENKCAEPCSFEPCEEPCPKFNENCGHPCIGLCGEKCPSQCKVCDQDEVTEIFFGDEDEDDARFVKLEDCPHIFELSGLKQWMQMRTDGAGKIEIGMKKCPRCSTPIYNTRRFQKDILESYSSVEQVKKKYFTNFKQNNTTIDQLRFRLEAILPTMDGQGFLKLGLEKYLSQPDFRKPAKRMKNRINRPISDMMMCIYEFQVGFWETLSKLQKNIGKNNENILSLTKLAMKNSEIFSAQRMTEIMCELHRIDIQCSVGKLRNKSRSYPSTDLARILSTIETLLDPTVKFTQHSEGLVRQYFKGAERIIGVLIELSAAQERKRVVQAVGLGQGHWYKCPNGHIYAIGNCGMANQVSRCPDCNAQVGGSGSLVPGNTPADINNI